MSDVRASQKLYVRLNTDSLNTELPLKDCATLQQPLLGSILETPYRGPFLTLLLVPLLLTPGHAETGNAQSERKP